MRNRQWPQPSSTAPAESVGDPAGMEGVPAELGRGTPGVVGSTPFMQALNATTITAPSRTSAVPPTFLDVVTWIKREVGYLATRTRIASS